MIDKFFARKTSESGQFAQPERINQLRDTLDSGEYCIQPNLVAEAILDSGDYVIPLANPSLTNQKDETT